MSHLPNVYATINIADLPLIDFSQIGEDNENTIRKSLDGTEFLIKWYDEHEPTFIADGSVVPLQTMTPQESLALMNTPAWSEDIGDLEDKRKIDKDVNNKENKA
tara:strand:+ start:765 stop:1076 length:312 start_codon:yes stop_codon:yes gene_type:complete